MKIKNYYYLLAGIIACTVIALILFSPFSRHYNAAEKKYIEEIEKFRQQKDKEMHDAADSPFNAKGKIAFDRLKYFDVDPAYVFRSKLYEFEKKDTIIIYGTKGEPRTSVRYGYVKVNLDNQPRNINVYKSVSRSGQEYFGIWFTDKTTGAETYGVGRYLDFEKSEDKDHIYTIDFNLAYNPYCAYSHNYSCAIPTKEDFISAEIKAGEKIYH